MNSNSPETQKQNRDNIFKNVEEARKKREAEGREIMAKGAIQIALRQLQKDQKTSPPAPDQS